MTRENISNDKSEAAQTSDQITVEEAGRRGGRSTLEHRGTEFFREIGAKGGRKTAELYRDLLAEFGKRGGRPKRPTLNMGKGDHNRKEAGRPSGPPLPP